ncbi:MAG: hypothetical protein IIZ67_04880 [Bacilli bacterium]|nr:hypothetical protein [Bacilli bacterium]
MLKFGFEIKQVGETINIHLVDPTKKQQETATDEEKLVGAAIKDLLDNRLLDLLNEQETKKEN